MKRIAIADLDKSGNPARYLGVAGWTTQPSQGLRFLGRPPAETWLEDARRQTPGLFAGRVVSIVESEVNPDEIMPTYGSARVGEYDPHAAAFDAGH